MVLVDAVLRIADHKRDAGAKGCFVRIRESEKPGKVVGMPSRYTAFKVVQ
jgi:hypothetical protein